MRPSTACLDCRNRRRRCVVKVPGQPCAWCSFRNVYCTLLPYTEDVSITSEADELEQRFLVTQLLPPRSVCEHLIMVYFRYIHDTCQWIFHRPTLLEDFKQGTLSEPILYSIIAVAARFSNHPFFTDIDRRRRALPYVKRAAASFDPRNVSTESIQLCLLLGALFSFEGEAVTEGSYYGLACRMASLIKLHQKAFDDAVESELNTRLLWTLKMNDVWSSAGNHVQRMRPPVPLQLPISEKAFSLLRRGKESISKADLPPETKPQPSVLGEIVRLNDIFERVTDQITVAVEDFPAAPSSSPVADLIEELTTWHANLDPILCDTEENLKYHAGQGEGHIFVSLYLGFYHYGQLTSYPYLYAGLQQGLPNVGQQVKRCKEFAAALCEILYRAYETPGAEVYYPMVGHVLVIASTVQIYTVLFGEQESEIQAAKHRLQRNYQILTELLRFWPMLDVSHARLQAFHDSCLRCREETFRVDQWMRRFLFEFAVPIEPRLTENFDPAQSTRPLSWPPANLFATYNTLARSFDDTEEKLSDEEWNVSSA